MALLSPIFYVCVFQQFSFKPSFFLAVFSTSTSFQLIQNRREKEKGKKGLTESKVLRKPPISITKLLSVRITTTTIVFLPINFSLSLSLSLSLSPPYYLHTLVLSSQTNYGLIKHFVKHLPCLLVPCVFPTKLWK